MSENILLNDKQLTRLCLDDGSTYVTAEGGVKTSNIHAPKLDEIVQYVKSMEMMTGREVSVEQTSPSVTEAMMEILSASVSLEQDSKKQGKLGAQLITLCQAAVEANASDIHIEVHRETTRFLMRVDGDREWIERFSDGQSALHQPREAGTSLATYIFGTLGERDIKLRDPADGRFEVSLQWKGEVKIFEWRAALMPLNRGVKLTLRCLTPRDKPLELEDMDLPKAYEDTVLSVINKRNGAIVLSGPVGSGKSTFLNAVLRKFDSVRTSVHCMEDPVEFEIENVCKTTVEPEKEVKLGTGVFRDYAFYTKETLRHDVDKAVIGEIRDHAAALQFCRKGEVGGLVLATLHTNSAIGIPQTFIQALGMPASVVGAPDLMLMFIHLKLVKKLCRCALPVHSQEAKEAYQKAGMVEIYQQRLNQLNSLLPEGEQGKVCIPNPCGCDSCNHKGEKGRLSVMEIIVLEDADRRFIANEDIHGWKEYLKDQGWPDIRDHAISRIKKGQVDIISAAEQVDGLLPVHAQNTYRSMKAEL